MVVCICVDMELWALPRPRGCPNTVSGSGLPHLLLQPQEAPEIPRAPQTVVFGCSSQKDKGAGHLPEGSTAVRQEGTLGCPSGERPPFETVLLETREDPGFVGAEA